MFKFILAALLTQGVLGSTPITECSIGIPSPTDVQLDDCQETPCVLTQGTTSSMNITFTAAQDLQMLHIEVAAIIDGVETPYPLDQHDACETIIEPQCPITEGQTVISNLQVDILDTFPAVPMDLKFGLFNDHHGGDHIICFNVPVIIVAP